MEESEKADSETIPTNDDASPSQGKSCALCGCATPAVRCDRCNSQIFCLSCDDMYHRHPKRKLHLRKAVDSIWTTARSPRLRRRTELPGDPCKIPIPPPRSKKREHRTIGGRTFLKSGLELGSFGHSKVFSPASKDFFAGQKSPASLVESNCDDGTPSPNLRSDSGQIYENDNITNTTGNFDDRSPWNPRPNISSPIQVSIPSSSPDIVANGQSFGYPTKPHSQSAADLTTHAGHPVGHHPYHFHPPYPYMHPPMHPYSHSMAHLNCAQCISSSWSNLISPHPSPYFHPMPWGSAQNTMSRPPFPGQPSQPMKHSHGDLPTYPDSGLHYPYPGAPYYHNGPPVVDPNFIKDLHEQAEMQKQRKETKSSPRNEEMEITTNPSPPIESSSNPTVATSAEPVASATQDAEAVDEMPAVPEKPTEPWSCVHCTFINPPGIHICQVCCKTSYGNKPSDATEEQSEDRPESRDTDSPLINRDALMNSPGVSEIRNAQKDDEMTFTAQASDFEFIEQKTSTEILNVPVKLTTETQTFTTTKTTDVQTQNITRKSIASSTDSIFPKQEISVQTEIEALTKHCSVATDPMISSQSLESLLSGVSAPPYHNRRAGWGRGATSFSTQSLYERGRSRSPMPRSLSFHTEAPTFGRDSSFASEEAMHSASQAWLYADPMYYKPHNRVLGQSLTKEDYFDGTWGSMDRLNHRVKHKKDKEKPDVRPKFHRSLDDLKSEKKPEFIHTHELMMLQTVKEAERCGFTLEDLHVAYLHCGKENPVFWLEDNWPQMIKNVIGLAAKYGEENEENDVGTITTTEAKEALRIHRGDIWDAVAECIETRQRKILELTVRGNFTQKQIAETLKNNEGNVELAYADLLRASTKRHKFILSPGLSTDSEDLNVYNPTEDSITDHNISLSPMKSAKLDASAESKSEKKKSDFLTKLTAIREAQSERRKAREEKELIRETITQDLPLSAESEDVLKEKDISLELTPSISREDSKEVEEILQSGELESEAVLTESKPEIEVIETKDVLQPKEIVEDNIPVDFDTNWSESQGEWIEEYSDEHWEEGDEHWVGLGKKFQKMQKEFEEEAMQMAALWEKEELEDDVFEDETKVQQEVETVTDSDKKFDEWVKANLKVDSSEYEEEIELKGKSQNENLTAITLRERLELEGSQPSPLQHYPTALDLSLKSQFESEWVDLPADAEIEKLAHDIVCEGSDIENKFDETEMVLYEEEKHLRKVSDQGSDEDWEKIEMDEQLQEVNELDNFAFPEKEGEIDRGTEDEIQDISDKGIQLPSTVASEITIDKDATVLYKNLENVKAADASDVGVIVSESLGVTDMISVNDTKKFTDLPKVPVRRKSKLSSTDIDEALKNQSTTEIPSDIPPPLPEKTRFKGDQQKVLDIYAVPDKTTKVDTFEDHSLKELDKDLPSVPQKPPRLNLSSTTLEENALQKSYLENEAEMSQKALNKESSPIASLSYESDSNFFADSESETEINLRRPKNIHRKLAKYENEFEESEIKDISVEKLPKTITKENKDVSNLQISKENIAKEKNEILESNFDLELDDDIDPSLIEPLPRMKDIDYDPELPILLGGRGRQISDVDDVNAPKAFREDTTRPLQLFKATKKENSFETVNMPETTALEIPTSETSFIQRISDELPSLAPSNIPSEVSTKISEQVITESQTQEKFYYNDSIVSQQNFSDSQMSDLKPQEQPLEIKKDVESVVQQTPSTQDDEIPLTEIEALSAVADYFFGRYNEITVTPPKKKTPVRPKPVTSSTSKMPSKVMSSSEISSVPHPENISQMEQSASAVLQEKSLQENAQEKQLLTNINELQKEQSITKSVDLKEAVISPEKPKQPIPTECLSFAEDYLFGCYTQVVPPRKTKNVPVISAKIPKLGEISSLSRPQSPVTEHKPSTPVPTPEPHEMSLNKQEELVNDEVPEDDENDISIRTDTSATYDEVFHDFPPEVLSNQSFDESSIYYESFQDAIEDAQGTSVIDGSIVNVRPKSVHFEEPEKPVLPPRRNKVRQKAKAPSTTDPNESYANEYLFRQYEQASQAKKKLPFCSEDFRMNQGFEPTEIPSDTSLTPDDDEEEVICSETSVEISSKSNELFKSSSEYDFGDSEQPLDLIKHEAKETELKDSEVFVKLDDSILHPENNQILIEKNLEVISSSSRQDPICTDNQSESFEELSIPDNLKEMIESSDISEKLSTTEENKSLSGHLPSVAMESEMTSAQQVQPYDTISNETSNRLEIDEFVFIEQAQDIIDDSYNLYDIQDSLVCDLNYVDIKGNIEDECTDDSEQEWKRNEDRKNTLNASFLTNAPIKMIANDQEEAELVESQQYDQKEVPDVKQNEMGVTLGETQKSDIEKIECQKLSISELKMSESEYEEESAIDQTLMDKSELAEIVKENYEFSEKSDDIYIDEQIVINEVHDVEPNKATETIESNISTITNKFHLISENISHDNEKIISEEINEELLESAQNINEEASFMNDEYLIMSESFENLTEKIDENILEIEKELSESYAPLEFDGILSEELNAISADYEISDPVSTKSETNLELCEDETEISETDDMTVTEEVKLEFSKETEISGEVLMQNETNFQSSELIVSEINNLVMEDTAKLESDEEQTKEAEFMNECKILSEDHQAYVLEDFEASEELSDDNMSSHSSVSTQIAVSMKIAMKDTEGDECSLNLEQIDNFEEDSEPFSLTQTAASTSQVNISEIDSIKLKKNEEISDAIFSKKESHEYEIKNFESDSKFESHSEECRSESTPIPLDDIYTQETVLEKSTSDEKFDIKENIIDNIADESTVVDIIECNKILDHTLSSENSSCIEDIPEVIETVDIESKSYELENDEIEALMAEESIMSHFYDEWYQSEATKFSFLSAESIYAKYGSAESSESGNESDNGNTISTYDSKANVNETDVCKNKILQDNNIFEKDMKNLDDDSEESLLKKEIVHEVTECDVTSTTQKSIISDINEVQNEVDMSMESNLKSMEDYQEMYEKDTEESVFSTKMDALPFLEKETESVKLQIADEMSAQSVKEQEMSDTKTVINKFSTSKSCQTEDSFEEDIFFDSFDDTFTIPSYIHLPIEAQIKLPTIDVSVQCELISIDDILSSKKILSISQTEVIAAETQIILPKQDSPEESKLREERSKVSELASEEKEESSCESFEDSDSDIFIESPSSQDELEVSGKRTLLYAEVDSDTGFSSGSECGWTRKRDYKQKELKKVSIVSSESKDISLQTCASSEENTLHIDSTDHDIQKNVVEIATVSEKKMAANIVEKDVEIFSDNARLSPLPPEVVERAVTPVAIPQFPSFEDDLIFVEIKEADEEITDNTKDEIISTTSTTPTVEYFYGSLPETVKIESPPDSNDKFFETASELSESISLSINKTESFSDSTSSLDVAEKMSCELNIDNKVAYTMKESEDESFAETISSLKGETEDSISEYYSFPDSVSLISRASLAESDIFDFAQSEILTDEGLSVDFSPSYENKNEKIVVDLPISETNKISDITSILESSDKHSKNISNVESATHVKETNILCDISHITESSSSVDDQPSSEKEDEFLSICQMEPFVKVSDNAQKEKLIDSKTELSSEESEFFRSTEHESISSNVIKPASDVPPVPSDIIRYLYYDDSITFDDESYHTQSESMEVPSLASQDVEFAEYTDKIKSDVVEEKISTNEICAILPVESSSISEEKPTISIMESESESKISDEKITKVVHDFQEAPASLEISQEKIDLTKDKSPEDTINLADKTIESKLCSFENIQSLTETDLKFPSIEVLPSESIAVLPAAAEQTFETVLYKEESARESVIASDAPIEDISLPLLEDHKVQDIVEPTVLKQSSTEIPPVPSDIVRYLYYDDDITFDEMTQSSCQYDNNISGLEVESLPIETAESSISKLTAPDKSELFQNVADISFKSSEELPELVDEKPYLIEESYTEHKVSDISLEDSSYKPDSGSRKDEPPVSLDSSECYEDWFDLKETTGMMKHRDSEQYSSTRSSVLKEDSEPPCIPEYILSPKLSVDIPVGKNDVDEVTDISTHFTMTDDSDRFSDIENDISLNFEDEGVLPVDFSDQIQVDLIKDEELFVSCIKDEDDEDEMYLNTPDFEDVKNAFHFVAPESVKEFSEQVKDIGSISSEEIVIEQPKEQLKECILSVKLSNQQIIEENNLDLPEQKEIKDEDIALINSLQQHISDSLSLNKLPEQLDENEIDQQAMSFESSEKLEEMIEKFDECITSTSEVSKEDFAECLTSSEFDQKSNENIKEKHGEISDECIASTKTFETFEEQFQENLTSNKLSEEKVAKDTDKVMPENLCKFLEPLSECTVSDENGNFPELLIKEDTILDVTKLKDHVSSEVLGIGMETKESEISLFDKNIEISESFISQGQSVYSEPLNIISEAEIISHKESELNLLQTGISETISETSKHDLETSCYTSPTEESHSISTEISDNWSDADGRFIEEEESVYDVPLEEISATNFVINPEESNEKLTAIRTDSVNLELFPNEMEITTFREIDAFEIKSLVTEIKETDIKTTETTNISDFKPEISENVEDLNIKLIESIEKNQLEKSHDDSNKSDKFSELDEISVSEKIIKPVDSIKSDFFTPDSSFKENLDQSQVSYDNLLSSDMKPIHEIKLETESEISSTMKETVHLECMSTTSGDEPIFSPVETTHISEDVQSEKISSKEMSLVEEVVTSTLTQDYARERSSQDKISCGIVADEAQSIDKIDTLEKSDFITMETKSIEILDSEISDYVSISDSSKSYDSSLNNIQPEVKEKEPVFDYVSEDKNSENLNKTLAESAYQMDTIDYVPAPTKSCDFEEDSLLISSDIMSESKFHSVAEDVKLDTEVTEKIVETFDFKGDISKNNIENISQTTHVEIIQIDQESKEQDYFIMTPKDTDFMSGKSTSEKNIVETEEKLFISKELLGADDEKHVSETFVSSLKTGDDSISKIERGIIFETQESSEIVDFKGCITVDKDYVNLKMRESTEIIIDSKPIQSEKLVFSSDDVIPSEVIDFKGQLVIDLPNKTEIASKSTDKIPITIDKKESKIEISCESNEVVDFKLITNEDVTATKEKQSTDFKSEKLIDENIEISKESNLALIEKEGSFETIDFKGQIIKLSESEKTNVVSATETKSAIIEKMENVKEEEALKPVQFVEISVAQKSLPIQREADFQKAEAFDTHEIVDFKGQLTTSHQTLRSEIKDMSDIKFSNETETIPEYEMFKLKNIDNLEDSKQSEFDTFETVDFKGCLTVDELKISEEVKSKKNVTTFKDSQMEKLKSDTIVIESLKEVIDFKGVSSNSEIESLKENSEIINYDSQKTYYSFPEEQNLTAYDQQEIYNFNTDNQTDIFDVRETYGYGYSFDEQTIISEPYQTVEYGVIEESEVFVSQQLPQTDEMLIPETDSYIISTEESSELYSCAETLSATSDPSLQFHSFSHDLEDSLNVSTSEDFTDVPSHLTSTEDSDKWSDVEGDFLLDDIDYKRDKTPTRTSSESISIEREKFISKASDNQLSEDLAEPVQLKDENKIISDNQTFISPTSELVTTDLKIKFEKEDTDQCVIASSENVKGTTESTISMKSKKIEVISSLTENDDQIKLLADNEISQTIDSSKLQSAEVAELLSAEIDLSLMTASEDNTDVTSYISAEGFENLSDLENEVEIQPENSKICAIEQSEKFILTTEITHEISTDKSIKASTDIQIVQDDTLTPLMEHFADIKSLKDPLTTVVSFSSVDTEIAVPKMHEDVSSDIPSKSEKIEPELWLEAETEHSISDISEDIAVCVEKDGETKFIFVDYEKPVEYIATINDPSGTPHTSTTSTSSSYSDLENSDHTSDTYADISLQGAATTESSDKWSDFENEGLIDDVLDIDILENVKITDFSQLIKKPNENKFSAEISASEDQLNITASSAEVTDLSSIDVKIDDKEIETSVEMKYVSSSLSEPDASDKSTDLSSDNINDSHQTFSSEVSSVLSSSEPTKITVGLSDEEFTDVTPLEITAEASDKLSDISDDTSLGEIEDESSISLKATLKLQDEELAKFSDECKADLSSNIQEKKSENLQSKISEEDNCIQTSIEQISLKSDIQFKDSSDIFSLEMNDQINKKEQDIPTSEVYKKSDEKLISSLELAVDKKEKESLLLCAKQDSVKMKDSKVSQSSDYFNSKSSEISEQVDFKLIQKLDDTSSEIKSGLSRKELSSESQIQLSSTEMKDIETAPEQIQTIVSQSVQEIFCEEDIKTLKIDSKLEVEDVSIISNESKYDLIGKECHSIEENNDFGLKLKLDAETEPVTVTVDKIDQTESEGSSDKDKIDIEDSSSSKIIDDSEALDNFTDVHTHTITSEASDAYQDLDSDHSFEEIESLLNETENSGFQEVEIPDTPTLDAGAVTEVTTPSVEECYENSLPYKDTLEETDNFSLDVIPENELENYEEEEYSLSEHFEINEDELIYPLPYSDDWIEQSFELKEYGVEAEFFESESDIHGLGIVHEDYEDDDDIQRAIDYNLSTFEENDGDGENAITAESFKTLSHDSSPHVKADEYDTWSTADAPSIEEEFAEQDNILSKIDEILAEDFGDIYQPDSYLKHEEDAVEASLPQDIYPSGDKNVDIIQSTTSEKITKISTTNADTQKQIFEQHQEKGTTSEEISLKEDFSKTFEKVCETGYHKIEVDSKSMPTEITKQGDSFSILKQVSDTVQDTTEKFKTITQIEEMSSKICSKSEKEINYKSDKTIEKDINQVSATDSVLSDASLDKKAILASKAEASSLSSETIEKDYRETSGMMSSELLMKKDSESLSGEVIVKESHGKHSKNESDVSSYGKILETDSIRETTIKSDLIFGKISEKKDHTEVLQTKFEKESKETNIQNESKLEAKSESDIVSNEICLKRALDKRPKEESDALSSKVTLSKDYTGTHETELISNETDFERKTKLEIKPDSQIESDETILKKTSEKCFKTESDITSYEITLDKDSVEESKIECKLQSSEINIKKDHVEMSQTESEVVSSEIGLKTGSKSEMKPIPEAVFDESILKIGSKKDFKFESDVVPDKVISEQDSIKEFESESASLSKEMPKKDYENILKTDSDVVSDEISIQKDSKLILKSTSEIASEENFKGNLVKESMIEHVDASNEMTLKKKSVKEGKLVSDSVSVEVTIKKDSEQLLNSKQASIEDDRTLLKSTDKISEEKQISSAKETSSSLVMKRTESSEISIDSKDISLSTDVSTHAIPSSSDTYKDLKDKFSDVTILSTSKTDSLADIPLNKFEGTQNELSFSYKSSKESEVIESSKSSTLSESLKHSSKSASESTEGQLNIPKQKVCKEEISSLTNVTETPKEQLSSDSLVVEVKPDIPKKTKRKSLDLTETTPIKEEADKKPSLPPKKSKRHSLTDSASSSLSESLSSSSSVESIGSFESAVTDKSVKSSLKSSDETSMHSLSPEIPTRRSRSSRTSSSRSTSRDSDDNSSCSRSSSLKIRRRSSNFAEPEPIDLSKKRASIDERMKKLQIEGKCVSKEKAFIAAKLIEMQFEEEDALLASRQCNSVYHAVKFLTQLCDMCNCRFPINLMSSLVNCTHRACKECLKAHFTSLLYDRSVFTLLCPICHKPDITDQNIQEYFTHLDMTLRNILEDKVYDLFQRKLRDEVLTKDPNFHWCSQCSSGFIASPRLKKLYCPDCSAITCAMCHQTWELEHEGVHCERFQQWKDMHTPEPPPAGLVKFLIDRGISCPSCGLVYAQACGGCMMYKCSHCNFEFCGFCIRPLKKGRECTNEICDSRGHHIHHPHNCLFFIRDKDITEIQMLLEEESVTYFTIPPKNQIVKTRCQVREQKNNHGIIIEDRCGRPIEPYCGGLCRTHYYEYLAELLRMNNISPLSIMTIQDLQFMLRKSRIFVPEKVKGETSEDYYERLLEFVTKNIT